MQFQKAGSNFFNELFGVLTAFEGPRYEPYDAKDGVITIGVGFNLTDGVPALREGVYREIGLQTSAASYEGTDPSALAEKAYLKRLNDAIKAGPSGIPDLHAIMAERYAKAGNDPAFAAYIVTPPRQRFEFSPGQTGRDEMKAVMQFGITKYVDRVYEKLGYTTLTAPAGFNDSWEKAVLVSLAYNGMGAWPPGLTSAIKSGDRAEAWFQIRYAANDLGRKISQGIALSITRPRPNSKSEFELYEAGVDKGWAKRRYAEAELFGLYDNPSAVTETEAKQIFKMLEAHRTAIFAYEKYYGLTPDGIAGLQGNQVAAAASEYQYLVGTKTLIEALTPARDAFIAYANTLHGAGAPDIDKSVISNAASIYFRGDQLIQTLDARVDDARPGNALNNNLIVGGSGKDTEYGGTGQDYLMGLAGDDTLYGNADNDILIGGADNDTLYGGDGTDTYVFNSGDGKDTIIDSHGNGSIVINGRTLDGLQAKLRLNDQHQREWIEGDGAQQIIYALNAQKQLTITGVALGGTKITINDFDVDQTNGYLGLKLDNKQEVAVTAVALTKSFWSDVDAKIDDLAGQSSLLTEGGGKKFVVHLKQAAKAGETITLHIANLVDKFAAILGDSKVPADGAVITLVEGQTQVSFSLVNEGEISAELTGSISVSYDGGGQTATSNTWGLNVKDAGETAKTFIGDQRALLWGVDLQPDPVVNEDGSVTQDIIAPGDPRYNTYAWSKTEWAADGTLTGGVAEAGFNDVIYGSGENEKIQGLGGNDALDGRGGNDYIEGGDGDDLIAGGAGSDHILGGAGNDVILSATTMVTPERRKSDDPTDPARIVGNVIVNGGPLAMDSASDVIEAGDGDDEVYAGSGDDRIDGGNGTDVLYGLGGDDVLEGGAGNDQLLGDGVSTPGTYGSNAAEAHGGDFLDGGEGNDQLIGGGKGDVLYGGGGDDDVYGDTSGDLLAGQHHGDDYLDGEDGTDRLWGNGANDTLYGGAGNDKLYGDAKESELAGEFHGSDYLDGEDGDDELVGFGKDDVLYGGKGSDYLHGDAAESELAGQFHGDDSLDGEDGDDVLIGGGKSDTLYGGAGNDQLQGDGRVDELGAEFHGVDYLDGEDGDDVLIGDGGADTLYGGTGNDYLAGDNAAAPGAPNHLSGDSHGNDYLDGGAGNDTLVGDGGADTLLGGAGNDILHGDNTLDWLAAQYHGNDFVDGGEGDDTLYGGGGDDVLQGGTGNDVLAGEAGADYMDGGAGDDTYLAGAGDTVVDDSNSINTLTLVDGEPLDVTASGADLLLDYGPNGVLTLVGALTGAIKQINGVSTRDWISTRLGTEVSLTTTGENQALSGGMGNDVLAADHAGASLYGAAGDDMLIGGGNFVHMDGGVGNDVLQAGDGGSEMHGGTGDDTIYGGAGNDFLDGGASNDVLAGGEGLDTYYMSYGMGVDRVVEGMQEGGVVQLSVGLDADDISAQRFGNDLMLQLDATNSLRLQGYFDVPAASWVLKDGQGRVTPLTELTVLADPSTAQNEFSLVQSEQSAYRIQLESGIRWHYAILDIANLSRYQTREDGTIYAHSTTRLTGWENTSTSTRQYWNRYSDGNSQYFEPTVVTSSWSDFSLTPGYGAVEGDVVSIKKTVTASNDAVVFANGYYEIQQQTRTDLAFRVNWGSGYGVATSTQSGNQFVGYITWQGVSSSEDIPVNERLGFQFLYTNTTTQSERFEGVTVGMPVAMNVDAASAELPTYVAMAYKETQITENIQTINLGDADNTVFGDAALRTIVNSGGGNDTVYGAGYAYGGAGNDTLVGGGTLRGGEGDDLLRDGSWMAGGAGNDILIGGETMVAGAGRDEIYAGVGPATIEIDPTVVTDGLLGGAGDSTYFLEQYYQSQGIDDWEEHRDYPGLYRLRHSDIGWGYGSREDLIQNFRALSTWASFEVGLAEGWIHYLAPLPPAPLTAANNFRTLEPYYEQGVLQHHTVAFGAGVRSDNLQLSWVELDVAVSGELDAVKSTHAVLKISWNGGLQNVQVIIPHSDDPLGSGVSRFTFADGTVLGMADVLDLAPPVFTLDPHLAIRFEDGSGEIVINSEIQLLGFDFNRNDLDIRRDGTDLLLAHSGTADMVRLTDWYGQLGSYQGFKIKFSDDAALTSADLTDLGLIMDGSAGNQTLAGLDGYANTFIAGPNDILIAGDGGQDTFVFNAGAGTVHIQDSTGTGTIVFGEGITAEQISLGLGSLLIRVGNSGDAIHIDGFDSLDVLGSSGISTFKFADGEVMSLQELVERGFDIGDSMESGVLSGTNLQDRIVSVAGQDTLVGGRGDDILMAGADANVFVFEAGDGHDLIDETAKLGANAGGDVVRFGTGIFVDDMLYAFQGDRLIIMVNGKNNTVSVLGDQAIGRIEFADGSYQTYQSLGAQTALVTTYGPDGSVISALELSHDAGLGVTTGVVTSDVGQILSRYTLTMDSDQAANVDVYDGTGVKTESYTRLYSGTFISGEGWNSTRVDYDDGTAAIYKVRAQGATRLVRLASDGTVISDDLLNYEVADSNLDAVAIDPQSGEVISGVLHAAVGGHSTLTGTSGLNTFVLGLGDGINVIDDSAASLVDGGDSIRFGVGIRAEDVRIDQVGSDLLLRYSADDYVVVRGMNLLDMDAPHYISNITFEGSSTASISIWKGSEDGESGYEISGVSEAGDRLWGYYRSVDGGSSSWEEHYDEDGVRTYYDGTWRSADGTVSRYTRSGDTYESSYYEPNDASSANFTFPGTVYRTGYGKDNEYAIWHEYDASHDLLGHGETHWQSIDFGGVISWTDVFDAAGRLLTRDWYDYPHGLMGRDEYGADGSVSKTTRNLWEGGYSVYTDDGHGNVHTMTYDANGDLVSDNWEHTNAAPLSNADLEDQAVQQGDAFDFQIPEGSFSDPDAGDALTYSAALVDGSPLPDWLSFDSATHKFSGVPPLESAGTYTVTLRVTDSWGAATQQDFTLAVSAANNAAPLAVADLLTVQADSQISANGNVLTNDQDADAGDTLSVVNPGTYQGIWGTLALLADGSYAYSLNTDRAELAALSLGQSAQEIFSYGVTDGHDATSGEITITIQGSNDAPLVAAQVGERVATEDAAWSYAIPSGTFADVDSGDALAYSVTQANGDALPSWLHFDVQTATLGGTPGNADVGDLAVRITATDLQGASVSQVFNLSVANANDVPSVDVTLGTQVTQQGAVFSYILPQDAFQDQDAGDALSYSATLADGSVLPSWLSFDAATRTLSGIPANGDVGSLTLKVTATDGGGLSASQTLDLSVANVNDVPQVILTLAAQTATEQQAFSYTVPSGAFADIDVGDTLTYSMSLADGSDLPSWLSFDAVIRTLSGTPAWGALGGLDLLLTATDSAGASVTQSLYLGIQSRFGTSAVIPGTENVDDVHNWSTDGILFRGLGGDDVVTSNVGADYLYGGDGADQLYARAGDDYLDGGAGDDNMAGEEGNDMLLGGTGVDSLNGGAGNDILQGQDGEDFLTGGDGDDQLDGGADYDVITGGLGQDTLLGGAGDDALYGDGGNDLIYGQDGADYIEGNAGVDVLYGDAGNDWLVGGADADSLDGGTGADWLEGGAGDDTYYVEQAGDGMQEGSNQGIDTVISTVTRTLGSNFENLTLTGTGAINGTGNGLANVLIGNDAVNAVGGGAGADTLDGRGGSDTLTGGTGNDTYIIGQGYGMDTVVENDSTAGNTDVAQFLSGITADQIWLRQVGNNLEASIIGSSDALVLTNWYLGSQYHVEQFKTTDGKTLLDSQVQNLVQAMAAFTPPAAGQTTLPENYAANLTPVIAANWQ